MSMLIQNTCFFL